jgi:hypothetical protein
MMVHPCPRSHAEESRAATGSILCTSCVQEAERNLRALPGLHQECLHQASSAPRRTNPTKVSGSRRRDYLNVAVIDARHNILTILESWAGMVVEKLETAAPPRTVPHLTQFLALHLNWLVTQLPAVDFANEIENLVTDLRKMIDPEPGDLHSLSRHCVVDDCTGTISVPHMNGRNAVGNSIKCTAGHSWEMREWLSLRELMKRQRKGVNA